MSSFHGIFSCPHGPQSSTFLWVSLAAATVCTCYSIASCRLLTLEFDSSLGNFEDHFVAEELASTSQQYQVGVGLFTWLRPSFYVDGDDDTVTRAQVGNWREGSCVGYNTLQLKDVLDTLLEATRILGVFSVLISLSIFLFSLCMCCLSVANWQRYILSLSCFLVALMNGLVLLMVNSGLCTDMGTGEGDSHCVLDQGALVAIAAVILWVCSAMLAFFFIEPVYGPGYAKQRYASQKKKQKQSKKKKESSTPRTIQESFSLPSPKSDEAESAKAVKPSKKKRQSSKKGAVASTPTLHGEDEQVLRKSAFQRGFDKRNRGEEKKEPEPMSSSEDSYDCKPLRKSSISTSSQQKRSSTAGEILIDLRSADAAVQNNNPRPRSISTNTNTNHAAYRQSPPSQTQSARTHPAQTPSGSVLQEVERVLFFTDLPCSSNERALADDVSQVTGSTAPNKRRQQQLQKQLDHDLELQQSRGPFAACDPGCFH